LTPTQALEVIRHQQETGLEFARACVDLKFWDSRTREAVQAQLSKARPALGEVLVAMGCLTSAQLEVVLSEFKDRHQQ
jgi:hypothetical protein